MGQLTGAELRFGSPLIKDACVVEALVNIGEFQEDFFGVAVTVCDAASELVGDGKAEESEGQLLFWFDGEDVATDGFGLFRFVEVAVEFDFSEGFGDAGVGDGFQFVVHEGLRSSPVSTGTFTKSGLKSKEQIGERKCGEGRMSSGLRGGKFD